MIFLSEHPLLKNFSYAKCSLIFLNAHLKQFKRNQIVFSEGDLAESVFIIKSGEFCICKHVPKNLVKKNS